jgi:hypothetical protein
LKINCVLNKYFECTDWLDRGLTLAGKPKNKVVLSENRLCLNLVSVASEMSFDDFDERTVVFRAKAG